MSLIVSFYSYKGGVGRTQLAANLAAYLCYHRGRKVLLVEWDLEAPGLHYYFKKDDSIVTGEGLLDLLENYVRMMRANETNPDKLPKIAAQNFISLNDEPKAYRGRRGKIDFFPAGKYDENFSKRVNEFNWDEFKTLLDGNMYMAMLREQLKKLDYDYVFIDSRTGISDYSGYCTILLPDMNVFVVAPNSQNYKGAKKIAESVLAHDYVKKGNRKPYILPILSRLDKNAANAQKKINEFNEEFKFLIQKWDNEIADDILPFVFELYNDNTLLEYNSNIAIGENLLFTADREKQIGHQNFEDIANYFLEPIYEGKIIDFESVVDASTWFDKGYDFNENKKYEQAIYCYLKAIEIKPDYHETWNNLGVIYYIQESYDQAITCYQKAIEIKPDKYEAWDNLGNTFGKLKKYDQAIVYHQKAIEIKPDHYKAWNNLGNTYGNLENYDQSIVCYQKAIEIKSNYHIAWHNLGFTYSKLKNYNQAIVCYQKELEIKPNDKDVWCSLGWLYFIQGQFTTAEEYFFKSIEFPNSLMNLGHIRLWQGRQEEAMQFYRQSLEKYEDKAKFFEGMQEDFQYLQPYGVSEAVYQEVMERLKGN